MQLRTLLNYSLLVLLSSFFILGCKKDDEGMTGEVQFEMTDAPIDDAEVKGVFITVTDIQVDGESISDFSGKQTIDIMAYQNGATKALGTTDLEAGTYSDLRIALDYDSDAAGSGPGCYVLTQDDVKHTLRVGSDSQGEIKVNNTDFEVTENSTTNVVVDFDIRKAVRYQSNGTTNDQYEFATQSEMEASLRAVVKARAGTMKGNCSDIGGIAGERIVVYAYKKGDYNASTETKGQGTSGIMFKNAVTSSVVANDGDFELSFLEEGEYELHFAGYEDEDEDGKMELKGMLDVTVTGLIDLLGISLGANATVEANVTVIGLLP